MGNTFFGGQPAPREHLRTALATNRMSIGPTVDPGEPMCAMSTDNASLRSRISLGATTPFLGRREINIYLLVILVVLQCIKTFHTQNRYCKKKFVIQLSYGILPRSNNENRVNRIRNQKRKFSLKQNLKITKTLLILDLDFLILYITYGLFLLFELRFAYEICTQIKIMNGNCD